MGKLGVPDHKYTLRELEKKIEEFIEKDKEKGYYTIESLCEHLEISRQALSEWKHHVEYGDTICAIMRTCEKSLIERGIENRTNASFLNFYLMNRHDFKNKIEVESTQKETKKKSVEEIKSQIEEITKKIAIDKK